ncbi:MAG: 50S ribosomal protein L6 [Halanaerobiales bacterium]|nr:50S ribosomal protein L6 [Halanaerobiales bacterium]
MSRIGKQPVDIPEKVDVNINGSSITVKGPKGEITKEFSPLFDINIEDDAVVVKRPSDSKDDRSQHGLIRSLIEGMVKGVTEGFSKKLELVGVGYNAKVQGSDLVLEVGYSHPVKIEAPEGIKFEVEKNIITVSGYDKQLVGDIAANIRETRKPEPYKGKGVKYIDEHIRRKVGKTG